VIAVIASIGAYSLFMLRQPAVQALANPLQAHAAQLPPDPALPPPGATDGATGGAGP
jgi:hypothetical protein